MRRVERAPRAVKEPNAMATAAAMAPASSMTIRVAFSVIILISLHLPSNPKQKHKKSQNSRSLFENALFLVLK